MQNTLSEKHHAMSPWRLTWIFRAGITRSKLSAPVYMALVFSNMAKWQAVSLESDWNSGEPRHSRLFESGPKA